MLNLKHEDHGRLLAKVNVVKKHYKGKGAEAIFKGTTGGGETEEHARG